MPRRYLPAALTDRLPSHAQRFLVAPTPKALVGIALLTALGLLLGLTYLWLAQPSTRPAAPVHRTLPPASAGAARPTGTVPGVRGAAAAPSGARAAQVVVDVTGAVRRPGLVRLPAGSRVADALRAVGGPSRAAEVSSVNLARLLVDGEQIAVLKKGQGPLPVAAAVPSGSGAASATAGVLLDLNSATLDQLQDLPGVGPVLAQRILDWRQRNGRFSAIDELQEVSGIGTAKFADLRPRVRV